LNGSGSTTVAPQTRLTASEAALIAAVRESPSRAAGWSELGRWYLDHGALEAARLCAARSQALDPSDRDAFLVLAATTSPDAQSPASARDLYIRTLAMGADHPYVHVNLALAHFAAGDDATATRHVRDALIGRPHDCRVRRALRAALARASPLYRLLVGPRRVVEWLRSRLATTRFGALPVIEIGYLVTLFIGVMHNPFNPHKAAAIFLATWFMAIWWPLLASLEAVASLRLRATARRQSTPGTDREALMPRGGVVMLLVATAVTASVALGRYVGEPLVGLFMMVFVELNSAFLVTGLMVTEIVRRARSSRYRARAEELIAATS